jgi:hypothetical protein
MARSYWPSAEYFASDADKATATAAVDEVITAALADAKVRDLQARERRLAETLADAKVQHGKAVAAYDQLAAAVQGVMLAEGDVGKAEADRDDAKAEAARWANRVADLVAAHGRAEQEATDGATNAVRAALGLRLVAAAAAAETAKRKVRGMEEEHEREEIAVMRSEWGPAIGLRDTFRAVAASWTPGADIAAEMAAGIAEREQAVRKSQLRGLERADALKAVPDGPDRW